MGCQLVCVTWQSNNPSSQLHWLLSFVNLNKKFKIIKTHLFLKSSYLKVKAGCSVAQVVSNKSMPTVLKAIKLHCKHCRRFRSITFQIKLVQPTKINVYSKMKLKVAACWQTIPEPLTDSGQLCNRQNSFLFCIHLFEYRFNLMAI